jgi:hypothetical protein
VSSGVAGDPAWTWAVAVDGHRVHPPLTDQPQPTCGNGWSKGFAECRRDPLPSPAPFAVCPRALNSVGRPELTTRPRGGPAPAASVESCRADEIREPRYRRNPCRVDSVVLSEHLNRLICCNYSPP